MTQYKVGVIGCGNRGRRHAEGYQATAQVAIAACADPVAAARASFAEDSCPQHLRTKITAPC